MENFLDILKQANLSGKDIERIQKIAVPQNIKTHKILVDYGEPCNHIYFILKGGFVQQVLKDDGSEKTINFFLDSFQSFMTIPHSYFHEVPSDYKLTALRNSDIIGFPKNDLNKIVDANPAIKEFHQSQIIRAFLTELDFRTKLLTYSPKRLYELLIADYQEVIQNVSSRHIANFIGISPEWLSNLKKDKH